LAAPENERSELRFETLEVKLETDGDLCSIGAAEGVVVDGMMRGGAEHVDLVGCDIVLVSVTSMLCLCMKVSNSSSPSSLSSSLSSDETSDVRPVDLLEVEFGVARARLRLAGSCQLARPFDIGRVIIS